MVMVVLIRKMPGTENGQNPNLTTTQPQPNLNLVGFDMIITLHTTPPELLLPEWMILGVWNFAGNLTKQNKQQPNTILTLLFSGGVVIYPPLGLTLSGYLLTKKFRTQFFLTEIFFYPENFCLERVNPGVLNPPPKKKNRVKIVLGCC